MPESAVGFVPDWSMAANVRAFITCRSGGNSSGSYTSNNLAQHVGDDPEIVEQNRHQLLTLLSYPYPVEQTRTPLTKSPIKRDLLSCQWLQQVHGNTVVDASRAGVIPQADGCITSQSNLVCAVMTADCVPLLICDQKGEQVAAVHAGWRGLESGIIRQSVKQFKARSSSLSVYIGPAICQKCYEVTQEVRDVLLKNLSKPSEETFYLAVKDKPDHYLISLVDIARAQLEQCGVTEIHGGDICNCCDDRFYSYRGDRQLTGQRQSAPETGRFASLVWRV